MSLGCERDPGPKVTWPTTPLPDVKDLKISSSAGGPAIPAVPPKSPEIKSKDDGNGKQKPKDEEKSKADK